MPYKNILVVGGGAIGGITAAPLILKGENVIVVDADREHVAAMNKGLVITGLDEFTVPVKAMAPADFSDGKYAKWADIVLLAVKGLHTENALRSILPGYPKLPRSSPCRTVSTKRQSPKSSAKPGPSAAP